MSNETPNEENSTDLSMINRPFIDGDHMVNATRGQMISMRCVVNNLKNYKVIFYIYCLNNPIGYDWKQLEPN